LKTTLFAFAAALAIAWLVTPFVRRLAVSHGVIVYPSARRVHTTPTPLWGGMGIWLGVVVGILLAQLGDWLLAGNVFITRQVVALLLCGTLVAIAGAVDDKYELSALVQLAVLMAISLLAAILGVRIDFVTNPFGHGHMLALGGWAYPVTVVWLFVVTKTIDVVDGLDGLCAGVCAIASCALSVLGLLMNTPSVAVVCAAVTGGSLGFLRYNYPPAKLFMGTVGSQFMGFLVAGSAVIGAFKVAATFAVVVPILALGIPLFDAVFAVARRAVSGKPVYVADRGHIHHRLLDAGLTQGQAILVIYAGTALLSTAALIIFVFAR